MNNPISDDALSVERLREIIAHSPKGEVSNMARELLALREAVTRRTMESVPKDWTGILCGAPLATSTPPTKDTNHD